MTTPVYLIHSTRLSAILPAIRRAWPTSRIDTHTVGRKWVRISVEAHLNPTALAGFWHYLHPQYLSDSTSYWNNAAYRTPASRSFRDWRPDNDPSVIAFSKTIRTSTDGVGGEKVTLDHILRTILYLQSQGYNRLEIDAKLEQLAVNRSNMSAQTIRRMVVWDWDLVSDGIVMSPSEQVMWKFRAEENNCKVTAAELPHFRSSIEACYRRIARSVMQYAPA